MLVCGMTTVPSFNGKSENLHWFFEDIEDHANCPQLNNADHIKWALQYTNLTDAETWCHALAFLV